MLHPGCTIVTTPPRPRALASVPAGAGAHPDTLGRHRGRFVPHGRRLGVGVPGRRRRPGPRRRARCVPHRPIRRDERRLRAFVAATGWRTDAERFGWSFVFAGLLPDDFPDTSGVVGAEWWRQVLRRRLAAPGRPRDATSTVGPTTRRPRLVERCGRVLPVDRHAAADRGRMGVRGARRAGRERVPVGRRPRAGRRAPDERVPRALPRRQHRRRRLCRHGTGGRVPTQWLRAAQRDRQRVGVVRGLARPGFLPSTARCRTPAVPLRAIGACNAGAPTCATSRTAAATACRRASGASRRARPGTPASAWPPTSEHRPRITPRG